MPLTARESVQTIGEVFARRFNPDGSEENVVPFGIDHIDASFIMGVEPTIPQVYVIQGDGGTRKTTVMLNFILRMCLSGELPLGHQILIDSLENGMTVERYLTTLRMMTATLILIYEHWLETQYTIQYDLRSFLWELINRELPREKDAKTLALGPVDMINGKPMPLTVLTMDFIKAFYKGLVMMTEKQARAWDLAGEIVADFPITVFGVSEHPDFDKADARSDLTTIIDDAVDRWKLYAKEYQSVQVVVDYMQEYYFPNFHDLYNKQLVVVPKIAQFVKEVRKTVWIISQESVGQQKEFADSGAVRSAAGGNILRNASHTNWRVDYKEHVNPYSLILFRPSKSRRGIHPDLALMIEPNSGVIFGKSRAIERSA